MCVTRCGAGQPGRPHRVAIIDDHEMFRTTLGLTLRERGFVTDEPATRGGPTAILAQLNRVPGGLALLDLHLGDDDLGRPISGVELVDPLRSRGWSVLAVTEDRCPARDAAAVTAGAIGTVSKVSALDAVLCTVHAAALGKTVMDEVARQRWIRRHDLYQAEQRARELRARRLSPREREVLDLLALGHRAAGIAATFGVSLSTVRAQIRAILAKLDVSSQLEAVALIAALPSAPPVLPAVPRPRTPGAARASGRAGARVGRPGVVLVSSPGIDHV